MYIIKKVEKDKIIKFSIIFLITLLLCQNFLQMHFSSDTYVLYDLGYMNYPQEYFLKDGRIISSIICFLAGILNIPMQAYIIGMDFIGIVFISISIYIINQVFEEIIKPKKSVTKIALTASCFVLILNQFTLEYLLFPESAVMCLGVLLVVLAVNVMVKKPKYKYVKIFLLLMLAALSYQFLLNMFPVLVILVYIARGVFDNRDWKIKLKEFFIEMIKLALLILLILLICIVTIKICNKILETGGEKTLNNRILKLANLQAIISKGKQVKKFFDELWNKSCNMLPPYVGNITIVITIVLLITLKTKKEVIIQYIALILVAFLICILPMFIFNITGPHGRLNEPLTMIWGASLIILLAQIQITEKNKVEKLVYVFVIISFTINSIFLMQNITEHIASNKVEENMGKTIKRALDEYEEETGIIVTKFGYTYDLHPQKYVSGIKAMRSLTERKLGCAWSIEQAMNFYCERKFERAKFRLPENIYKEKVYKKDYNEFSNDQIIFYEDALFLIVY